MLASHLSLRLECVAVSCNVIEAVVSVAAAVGAGSVAVLGLGAGSLATQRPWAISGRMRVVAHN